MTKGATRLPVTTADRFRQGQWVRLWATNPTGQPAQAANSSSGTTGRRRQRRLLARQRAAGDWVEQQRHPRQLLATDTASRAVVQTRDSQAQDSSLDAYLYGYEASAKATGEDCCTRCPPKTSQDINHLLVMSFLWLARQGAHQCVPLGWLLCCDWCCHCSVPACHGADPFPLERMRFASRRASQRPLDALLMNGLGSLRCRALHRLWQPCLCPCLAFRSQYILCSHSPASHTQISLARAPGVHRRVAAVGEGWIELERPLPLNLHIQWQASPSPVPLDPCS